LIVATVRYFRRGRSNRVLIVSRADNTSNYLFYTS